MDQTRVSVLTSSEVESLDIVDTDLLAARLNPARFADLGMRKIPVASCLSEVVGAYCAIVGAFGKGTTGTVRHSQLFGKINYSGTTCKGYSGAAYMLGKQLIGVHLHGGSVNSGYSASYVLSVLQHNAKIKPEDSIEWLESLKNSGIHVTEDPEWQDLDESRIRVNGRYHIVERSNLQRVYGLAKAGKKAQPEYVDQECASCSGEASVTPCGASSVVEVSRPSIVEAAEAMTLAELESLRALLARRAKKIRDSVVVGKA